MHGERLHTALRCLVVSASAGCFAGGDTVVVSGDASIQVTNDSDFAIEQLFLTDVGNPNWGPNLLRGDALLPGERLVLGVQCGLFDALIVDDHGVQCELRDLDLCLNHAEWVIRDTTCTVSGAD